MPERTFVLTHTQVPKSVNHGRRGAHWASERDEKRKWEGIYLKLLLEHRVPRGMIFCRAAATVRWKHRNRRDETNYIDPIVKPLADTLSPPKGSHAPRWLADDTGEFFKFGGVTFEYPEIWPHLDPRVKSELVIHLLASYPEEPAASSAHRAPGRRGRDA